MTVTEAAKILRIGKNKVYDLIKNGKLSSIKMGGKIIVPKMSVGASHGQRRAPL
ncbi:MAG: helix-turn-helix domain-containing protein [Clostridia bacterium]|nr:helix-turn-helix domain-containing protein [Clostridia bacterium]